MISGREVGAEKAVEYVFITNTQLLLSQVLCWDINQVTALSELGAEQETKAHIIRILCSKYKNKAQANKRREELKDWPV